MFGQQNKLKELFGNHGWELVENQVPSVWWVAEIWLIKSIWTPLDCHVFLLFMLNEEQEDIKRKFEVWSIRLTLSQPQYWRNDNYLIEFKDDDYAEISIKRKWEKRIPEFFKELENLRQKFNDLKN